jgi:tetratricopeptide (TPR) repeat protein
MAGTSEIEKLERRYAENPDGRYFAPLADAYRKAGQVDHALEVVRAGIEKHPDYLSAHIVLGRCLLDKKDDGGAGGAFRRVLTLDSENIIALKSLAEIAERGHELVQARQWLQQLLKVDPMNADAEADLQRLGGAIGEMQTAPMTALPADLGGPPVDISFADVRVSSPDILPPHPPEVPPTAPETESLVRPSVGIVPSQFTPPEEEEVPAQALDIKPFDEGLAWGTGERSSRAVSQKDIESALQEHEASLAEPSELLTTSAEKGEHVAPEPVPTEASWTGGPTDDAWSGRASLQTQSVDAASITVDIGADQSFDFPADRKPETSLEGAPAVPAEAGSSLADLPIIMPEDVTPAEEMARPSSKQMQAVEPEAVEAASAPAAEPPPLLTETMGDLYLRQGFRAEAADVYRRLLAQRPADAALQAKLAAHELPPPALSAAALGTESARTWLRRLAQAHLAGPAPAAPPPPEGPTPLDQAFAQPEPPPAPAPPPEPPAGQPARPAQEAFTLDNIFGAQGGAAPAPAAQPAPPPPPTGTSFDEFFGAPREQGSVRPDAAAAPSAPPPDDDVGSFNNWLRGLKR